MQAEGWRAANADRIALDSGRLRNSQGLITCLPASVGHKPFHACLQVHEEAHVLHQVGLSLAFTVWPHSVGAQACFFAEAECLPLIRCCHGCESSGA